MAISVSVKNRLYKVLTHDQARDLSIYIRFLFLGVTRVTTSKLSFITKNSSDNDTIFSPD